MGKKAGMAKLDNDIRGNNALYSFSPINPVSCPKNSDHH
jgi:hypothetical protein